MLEYGNECSTDVSQEKKREHHFNLAVWQAGDHRNSVAV